MTTAPDTLSTARRLQTEFGMEQLASEGVAIAIHDHVTQNLATKEDVELLKGDIEVVKADLERQIAEVRIDMSNEFKSLYLNLWAMAGVIIAATVALGKLLP